MREQHKKLGVARCKVSDLFENNELFDSFQALMKDRDRHISNLVARIKKQEEEYRSPNSFGVQ